MDRGRATAETEMPAAVSPVQIERPLATLGQTAARAGSFLGASRVAHQAAEESAEGAPQQIAALLNWDSDHAFRPQFTKHPRHAQWRNRIEIFHGKSIVPQLG